MQAAANNYILLRNERSCAPCKAETKLGKSFFRDKKLAAERAGPRHPAHLTEERWRNGSDSRWRPCSATRPVRSCSSLGRDHFFESKGHWVVNTHAVSELQDQGEHVLPSTFKNKPLCPAAGRAAGGGVRRLRGALASPSRRRCVWRNAPMQGDLVDSTTGAGVRSRRRAQARSLSASSCCVARCGHSPSAQRLAAGAPRAVRPS